MEKKVFFGAILLAALLFGILFLTIDRPEEVQTAPKAAQTVSEKIDQSVQTASSEASEIDNRAMQVNSAQETEENSGKRQQVDKIEKAPPAFGYMGKGARLQIVGLMSKEDSKGPLKSYLDSLCQKLQCSVDVGYQRDITEAPWQEDVVMLLKLFASDGVEDGSLFIEANSIKIEGNVAEVKEAVEVQKILNRLAGEGLKVENYIKMSEDVAREVKEVAAKSSVPEKNNTAPEVTKQNITTAVPSKKSETKPADVVKKEPQIIGKVPVKKVQKMVKKTENGAQKVQNESHAEVHKEKKPASSKKIAKKIKKSPKPKRSKIRRKPQKDIVAHSYMETSFDLTERIKAKTADAIKERKSSEAKEDIVAKPKLHILK
jgi:hypothetical protein